MMAGRPTADVVIHQPDPLRVHCQYDPKQHAAPMVWAKSGDELAFKYEIAREKR